MPALIVIGAVAVVGVGLLLEWRGDRSGRRVIAATSIVALAALTTYLLLDADAGPSSIGVLPTPTVSPTDSAPAASPEPGSPAPSAEPTIIRYEASLAPGGYTLFRIEADGTVSSERTAWFDDPSMAPVDRVEAADGAVHWRTVVGSLAGLSYVPNRSGPFQIRAILRWPDGHTESRLVDPQS